MPKHLMQRCPETIRRCLPTFLNTIWIFKRRSHVSLNSKSHCFAKAASSPWSSWTRKRRQQRFTCSRDRPDPLAPGRSPITTAPRRYSAAVQSVAYPGTSLDHSRGRGQYLVMFEKSAHSEPGDLAKLGELIREIRVALLTTVDRDGHFHTRPVQTLQVEANRTLWFFTDWSSPKVDELNHNVRVSLGYADPAKKVYVAVTGASRLMRDREKAKELWSVEQRA